MRAFRNVVAYMGFGFYWAWIFVSFNSVGSLGQNLPIDALTSSHLASSVAAILPLLAVFLLRGKIASCAFRARCFFVGARVGFDSMHAGAFRSADYACGRGGFGGLVCCWPHAGMGRCVWVARCQECGYLHRSFVRVCRAYLFRHIVYAVVRRRFCCDGVAPRYRT